MDPEKTSIFDDEGNPHQIYEFEDEEDFRKAGDAETQKADFISKESEVLKERDLDDKQLAKEKKLEKKRKRQEAERRAKEEDEYSSGDEAEPVVYLGAQDVDLDRDMEHSESESDSSDEPPSKKAKWFDNDKVGGREAEQHQILELEEPETIEDLEALTARLISQ